MVVPAARTRKLKRPMVRTEEANFGQTLAPLGHHGPWLSWTRPWNVPTHHLPLGARSTLARACAAVLGTRTEIPFTQPFAPPAVETETT